MTPVPWAEGFQPPSKEQIDASVGTFPCPFDGEVRRNALQGQQVDSSNNSNSLDQIDVADLFRPKQVAALRPPLDPQDWLASYVEQGDPFDDYVNSLTLRSGRFLPHAGMDRSGGIVLVPIVLQTGWPDTALPVEELQKYLRAFFRGVPITLSPPAYLKGAAPTRMEWVPPVDAPAAPDRWVTVRRHSQPNRLQVNSDSLLACLIDLTEGATGADTTPFCVVGVTAEDLFSTDLFVAVLGLCRYHPLVQMSPEYWWKYGFSLKPKSYSYFESEAELVDTLVQSKTK